MKEQTEIQFPDKEVYQLQLASGQMPVFDLGDNSFCWMGKEWVNMSNKRIALFTFEIERKSFIVWLIDKLNKLSERKFVLVIRYISNEYIEFALFSDPSVRDLPLPLLNLKDMLLEEIMES